MTLELQIEDLTLDGDGVGRLDDGKVCFVPGALPGERVQVSPQRRKRQFDQARLEAILEPSPQRVAPPCPYFGVCGGCRLMHADVALQREYKERALFEVLVRVGRCTPEQRLPALVDTTIGYRRSARLGVKYVPRKGGVLVGFRERAGRYLADMQHCAVLHPALGQRIGLLRERLNRLSIREHIPQIEAAVDDQAQVALVLRNLQPLSPADQEQLTALAQEEGLQVYLQPGGPESVTFLAGPAAGLTYQHPAFAITIPFTPLDFFQVHAGINRAMVQQAIACLQVGAEDHVLDLYCGLGNFTLPLARQAGQVTGVEGDAVMLQRAQANAHAHGLDSRIRYFPANLDAPDLAQAPWWQTPYTRALLDPPRTGALAVVEVLGARAIPRIVYVSCNPATLARDAQRLVQVHGYRLEAAGIMDMFPHTAHVESMAVFVRDG